MRKAAKRARCYCPKCRKPMHPLSLEGVEVDLCPDCLGMWFDSGELSRAAGLVFNTDAQGAALARASRTVFRCPLCAMPLYSRELDPGSAILVEQCVKCSGLFLDRDEFTRAREHYKGVGARRRMPRPGREPVPDLPSSIDPDSGTLAFFQLLTGLPLELDVPQTLFPPVVTALIVTNVVVLIAAFLGGFEEWIYALGLVPDDVLEGRNLYTFLTSMFMHGGVLHILGNMYFLYIAGDNVEERFGQVPFLGFYLLCGLVAGLGHVLGEAASYVPVVGASGAISGVLGAYMVLFPHTRFRLRWFYFLWHHVAIDMPAWAYFGFWILLQVVYAEMGVPGVAWWAHIGGFACGVTVALVSRAREKATEHSMPRRTP